LNIKGVYTYTISQTYIYYFILFLLSFFIAINYYTESDTDALLDMSSYGLIDNYYEALFNNIANDLFGFSIIYYNVNGVEFIFIGFLLLVGSVICVNLYQMNKNVRTQSYQNYLSVFNFFTDFTSFFFYENKI